MGLIAKIKIFFSVAEKKAKKAKKKNLLRPSKKKNYNLSTETHAQTAFVEKNFLSQPPCATQQRREPKERKKKLNLRRIKG